MKLAALALAFASPVVLAPSVQAQEPAPMQAEVTAPPSTSYASNDAVPAVDQPARTADRKTQKHNRSTVLHTIGYGLLTLLTATFSF